MRDERFIAVARSLSHERLFGSDKVWLSRCAGEGFVDEVIIFCDGVEIARHARSYARDDFVFEPRHYLALLEQKPGALDQAAPCRAS
jgi:hypothetical protein